MRGKKDEGAARERGVAVRIGRCFEDRVDEGNEGA
jgi:hypothetical protein